MEPGYYQTGLQGRASTPTVSKIQKHSPAYPFDRTTNQLCNKQEETDSLAMIQSEDSSVLMGHALSMLHPTSVDEISPLFTILG